MTPDRAYRRGSGRKVQGVRAGGVFRRVVSLNVMSPTYEIAFPGGSGQSARLLALSRECMVGQPIPNLFFAAVNAAVGQLCQDDSLAASLRAHMRREILRVADSRTRSRDSVSRT